MKLSGCVPLFSSFTLNLTVFFVELTDALYSGDISLSGSITVAVRPRCGALICSVKVIDCEMSSSKFLTVTDIV